MFKMNLILRLLSFMPLPLNFCQAGSAAILTKRNGPSSVVRGKGLQWYDPNFTDGTAGRSDPSVYVCYGGPASNFPTMSTWMNFDAMFNLLSEIELQNENESQYISDIHKSIVQVSKEAKVDARVILAVIIQESSGNIRVGCTTSPGGVTNCGLMQSYDPFYKRFHPKNAFISIRRMVVDGTQGTPNGPGLVQWFNDGNGTSGPSGGNHTRGNVYKALRGYNSGGIDLSDLSNGEGATNEYVSDVANYLQGWGGYGDGQASCTFNPQPSTSPTPPATTVGSVPASACTSTEYVSAPTPSSQGATPDCCEWYQVQPGDYCYKIATQFGVSVGQFEYWNPAINSGCTNLYVGDWYCVSSDEVVPMAEIVPQGSRFTAKARPLPVATTTTQTFGPPTTLPSRRKM